MANCFERLNQDTAPWRQRFLEIPLIKSLLGDGARELTNQGDCLPMTDVYTRFLRDSYYHVRAAARVYALAGSRTSEHHEPIREWLLHHAVEEYGHHIWIMDDLRALGFDPGLLSRSKPSVWCDALVGYMYFVAGTGNPIGILGDTYVIEGLSQLFASQLAATMTGGFEIPEAAVNYLAKHGEADQGHMDEFRDLVNQHVRGEEDYQAILQVSRTVFALYGAMVENLGTWEAAGAALEPCAPDLGR